MSATLYTPTYIQPPPPTALNLGGSIAGSGDADNVFSAAAGTPPTASPSEVGLTAVNENTNEYWFVNSSLAWQQLISAT